jgi:hypothetical protein
LSHSPNSSGFLAAGQTFWSGTIADGQPFPLPVYFRYPRWSEHPTVKLARLLLNWNRFMEGKEYLDLVKPLVAPKVATKRITPGYAFVMGVEWQNFRQRLLTTEKPFKTMCLPENAIRFVKLAERHNRFVEDRPIKGVGWTEIWVGDSISQKSPLV